MHAVAIAILSLGCFDAREWALCTRGILLGGRGPSVAHGQGDVDGTCDTWRFYSLTANRHPRRTKPAAAISSPSHSHAHAMTTAAPLLQKWSARTPAPAALRRRCSNPARVVRASAAAAAAAPETQQYRPKVGVVGAGWGGFGAAKALCEVRQRQILLATS